jgi:hypothetical protein
MKIKQMLSRVISHSQRQELQTLNLERTRQEKRLEELTRATLDGETDWFLEVVKKDPACAIKIVEQCRKEKF